GGGCCRVPDQRAVHRRAVGYFAGHAAGAVSTALRRTRTAAEPEVPRGLSEDISGARGGRRGALCVAVGAGFSAELSADRGVLTGTAAAAARLRLYSDCHRAGTRGYHPPAWPARSLFAGFRL